MNDTLRDISPPDALIKRSVRAEEATPGVLILDEPTTGLDPKARPDMWAMIRALAGSDVTVLPTTPYMDEADELADRIAVIRSRPKERGRNEPRTQDCYGFRLSARVGRRSRSH